MVMPFFEYLGPSSMEEALSLRARHPGDSLEVIAGGTEIMGRLKHGLCRPRYTMSLKNVRDLSGLVPAEGRLTIGSGTTLRGVITSGQLGCFSALEEAILSVAAPPIRNVATIGGSVLQQTRCLRYNQSELVRKGMDPCYKAGGRVCHVVPGSLRCLSVYQGDTAIALMAFEALLELCTAVSSRTVPIADLFTGRGENPFSLHGDELLTRIILALPRGVTGSSYKKLRLRSALDYPLAASAVVLSLATDGVVSAARIVIGAAGSAPKRVEAAEEILINQRPSGKDIEAAADRAARAAQTVDNLPLPAAYRRSMAGVMTKRAIIDALQAARGSEEA